MKQVLEGHIGPLVLGERGTVEQEGFAELRKYGSVVEYRGAPPIIITQGPGYPLACLELGLRWLHDRAHEAATIRAFCYKTRYIDARRKLYDIIDAADELYAEMNF